jgi:hypothetical protein
MSRADGPSGHVFYYDGPGTDHGTFTDHDAGMDEGFGCNPCMVADADRPGDDGIPRSSVIVSPRAYVRALRDDGATAYSDHVLRIQNGTARNARLHAHFEVPGRPDPGTRIHMRASADFRTEAPEKPAAPSMKEYG